MVQFHILNGDALKSQLPIDTINGDFIICRECLIDGPLQGQTLSQFWANRTEFIEQTFGTEPGKYADYVLPQFKKILAIPTPASIHLWFGDDLFCQMNLCFIIHLLDTIKHSGPVFLVKAQLDNWQEFGGMSPAALFTAYQNRQLLPPEDFQLLLDTWKAFQQKDLVRLQQLSTTPTTNFPVFQATIQAHIDRFPVNGLGRPQQSLLTIKEQLNTDEFGPIFQQFIKEEGIYGFGDVQVKTMLDELPEIKPKVYQHENSRKVYQLHQKAIEQTNENTTVLTQLSAFADNLFTAWQAKDPVCKSQINNWHPDFIGLPLADILKAHFTIEDAQLSIAKDCGFDNWDIVKSQAATTFNLTFEKAVNTLLAGDLEGLQSMIRQSPELLHLRSTYGHNATLLHYAGSNGVEMWRQQTPYNLPTIVQFLLEAGADKNATMNVYGGQFTTLEMVVTSAHPHAAGVVEELKELLG